MSYTFLQEQGAESSAECFSDIPASVLSRLNLTAAKSCSSGSETVSCLGSQSGMMSEHSMQNHGKEESMSFVEDSHAKTLASPEGEQELKANEADYGQKWPEWFAKLSHDMSSWKIRQLLLFEDLEESLKIWPEWGLMLNGECWEQNIVEDSIKEPDFGWWPTPNKMDSASMRLFQTPAQWIAQHERHAKKGTNKQYNLTIAVHFGCGESKWRDRVNNYGIPQPSPKEHLNPIWDEWLMGWPMRWTDLQPLGMDKFQQWLRSHGEP